MAGKGRKRNGGFGLITRGTRLPLWASVATACVFAAGRHGQIGQEVAQKCSLHQRLAQLTLKQNRRHGASFGVLPAESNRMSESFVKTLKRDHARLAVLPDAGAILASLLGRIEEILRDSPALQASTSNRLGSSSVLALNSTRQLSGQTGCTPCSLIRIFFLFEFFSFLTALTRIRREKLLIFIRLAAEFRGFRHGIPFDLSLIHIYRRRRRKRPDDRLDHYPGASLRSRR